MATPKPQQELVYCLDSHIAPDGTVYREADLVLADDPDIKKNPSFYAATGLPTATYQALRLARFHPARELA